MERGDLIQHSLKSRQILIDLRFWINLCLLLFTPVCHRIVQKLTHNRNPVHLISPSDHPDSTVISAITNTLVGVTLPLLDGWAALVLLCRQCLINADKIMHLLENNPYILMMQQFKNNTFETDQVRLIIKIDLCNHLCFHVLIEQWDISFKKVC